jgi:hypothetical protein
MGKEDPSLLVLGAISSSMAVPIATTANPNHSPPFPTAPSGELETYERQLGPREKLSFAHPDPSSV